MKEKNNYQFWFSITTFVTNRILLVYDSQSTALVKGFPERHCSTSDSLWWSRKMKKCDAVERACDTSHRWSLWLSSYHADLWEVTIPSVHRQLWHDYIPWYHNIRKGNCDVSEKNTSAPILQRKMRNRSAICANCTNMSSMLMVTRTMLIIIAMPSENLRVERATVDSSATVEYSAYSTWMPNGQTIMTTTTEDPDVPWSFQISSENFRGFTVK